MTVKCKTITISTYFTYSNDNLAFNSCSISLSIFSSCPWLAYMQVILMARHITNMLCLQVLNINKLTSFPVMILLRLCNLYYVVFLHHFFAIFKNVVNSLETSEKPSYLASHQALNYVQHFKILKNKNWVTVRDKCPKINVQFKWHTFSNGRTDKQTNERTDGRTEGRTDRRTDRRKNGLILLCPKFYLGA